MTKKILVVDDSFVMRALIKSLVDADLRLEVVGEASNGKEALTMTQQLNPDVILLDIEMPEMDGIEFMKRAKLLTPAKIIIISSVVDGGSEPLEQVRQLGAFAVIEKPSGSMSLDLEQKRGHEIVKALRSATGLQ
ncbi:MAG: response regulator [Methylococcaceae bacterium]